jgi:hypothetical protein
MLPVLMGSMASSSKNPGISSRMTSSDYSKIFVTSTQI